jgi:hypothetical protein
MTTMINLPTEVVSPKRAAELLRRRWQDRPAYFSPPQARPLPKLQAMWLHLPGGAAPVMRWSGLRGTQT